MSIRNKLILMLAIPLVALALVSAFGFREQSSLAETNEDAQTTAQSMVLLDELASQLGTERLGLASGVSPSALYPIARSTDALIEEIEQSGNTVAASVATAIAGDIPAVRAYQTPELMAGYATALERIDEANAAQSLIGFTPDGVLAARGLQIARASANTQELAWFEYFASVQAESIAASDTEEDVDAEAEAAVDPPTADVDSAVSISAEFSSADSLGNLAATTEMSNGTRFFAEPVSSDAAINLARQESEAINDLALGTPGQLSATDVFDELETNRAEWNQAISNSGDFLIADTNAQVVKIDERRSLFTLLAALGGLLLITLILVIGRSILGPMNRLMEHAELMTTERLPFAVAKLRTLGASDELPELRPIPKETNDEIGSLVDAFNEVQETAVRVATDQARSRRNVAEMFVSLGRRNQQLNHRMLNLISDLERDEQNPEVLTGLYQLDHLATRMRRNAESLLVLAGNRSPRQWSRPVAMEDVVRSALAEVELFERVEVGDLPETFMHGNVVTDVTHLLAELLDNATQFSEPSTAVSISAHETLEGVEIEVFDEGFGVNEHDLAELNERISNPPALDEAPSRLLGLFVVGRLAQQHNIDVHLQSQPGVGTVATVSLPTIMFPEEILDRSTSIEPPTRVIAPPTDLREDLAELASIDVGHEVELREEEHDAAPAWDPAAVHDEHLADASVPTMDEMREALPSFPGVTIDEPVATPAVEGVDATWPLAKLDPHEERGADPVSAFGAIDAIPETEALVSREPLASPESEAEPFDPQVAEPPQVAVVEPLPAPPTIEPPVAPAAPASAPVPAVSELPAPPLPSPPLPAPPVVAPPIVAPPVAAPQASMQAPSVVPAPAPAPAIAPVAEAVVSQEPRPTMSFGGLPTRSPQAALDAVDATPSLIPLASASQSETETKPAPPSAFAAFAFGVNRGLTDLEDEPKPQFSNEGDNE